MDENFTKFNSNILNKITNFINPQDGVPEADILYISGFQGSGKSEIVNMALKEINEDILLFRHLCFENSVIDDFLLGFYDTLRYYSLSKKINLKKGLSENFAQKVSFYFKNLDKKCLIIIDNFEIIAANSEIIDFLAHLAKYENVKLILISRILNPEFFENKNLNHEIIEIPTNDYFTFKLKVQDTLSVYIEDDIEKFYNATKGYELYLQMTLRYILTVNSSLTEFMEEFKKRNIEFEDFLLSKIVSLVPPIYLPFLQNMSCLNHSVKIAFIEYYGLGDTSLINYLYKKMLISKFDDEIYLKDYLKQYFLSNLSVKEKADNYKNLVKIYENELAKSPKDRLLRLSRESIRKQIDFIKGKIPNISNAQTISAGGFSGSTNAFSYIKQAESASVPWYARLAKLRKKGFEEPENIAAQENTENYTINNVISGEEILSEEERILIEQFRKNKAESTDKQDLKADCKSIINKAQEFEEKFDYQGAIQILKDFLESFSSKNMPLDIKNIYLELAKNYNKINNFEDALNNFQSALEICKENDDKAGIIDIKLLEADLYKKLYRLEKAKNTLKEAVQTGVEVSERGTAKAFLSLGEIYEMENDYKSAFENYQKAEEFALKTAQNADNDRALLSEIYYRTAVLYDDGQNTEKSLEYYQKSIENSYNSSGERTGEFLSASYANTGLIYLELWNETGEEKYRKNASNSLISALEEDKRAENFNGIYTICRQLTKIYGSSDSAKTLEYLNLALESSKKLNDSFKIAISHLETGDYYYNLQENVFALKNYLEAEKVLGKSISEENKERITTRINDMKIKMENFEFEEILKEYE